MLCTLSTPGLTKHDRTQQSALNKRAAGMREALRMYIYIVREREKYMVEVQPLMAEIQQEHES